MCLGVPGKVIEIDGMIAVVDFFGIQRPVSLQVVDEPVVPGDYVLNHVGFAIRRIPPEEIAETLALYERLIELAEEDDPMLADVRAEIAAAGPPDEPGRGGMP
jgi:hydrogenase expression/formation protein HypC